MGSEVRVSAGKSKAEVTIVLRLDETLKHSNGLQRRWKFAFVSPKRNKTTMERSWWGKAPYMQVQNDVKLSRLSEKPQ